MLGFSFLEILVIFIVAIIVLGPKELPHAVRKAGVFYAKTRQWLGKINAQAEEQLQLEDLEKRIKQASEKSDVSDLLHKPQEKP